MQHTTRISLLSALAAVLLSLSAQSQTYQEFIAKGDEFYSARKYKEAISMFTLAIGLEPQNPKGYYFRGDANRELKLYEASIEDYTNAVDLEPANAKFRRLRGDSFYDIKNYTRAEADYTKSLDLDPTSATTWLYRGDTYEMLKQNEKACRDYRKAAELGSRNGKPRAVKLGCEWTKNLLGSKPCPVAEPGNSSVQIDALTGALVLSKILTFESYEVTFGNGSFVGGPEFAAAESLTFTLINAQGFCGENPGTIHVGAGYEIRENGGREVAKAHNVFPNEQTFSGADAARLQVKFKLPDNLTNDKQYLLTVHFFDTHGNGEILIELPFKSAKNTLSGPKPQRKMIGDISTAGVGGTIGGIELSTKTGKIPFHQLARNTEYIATATNVMNVNKHSHFIFRFMDLSGKIVLEHKGKAVYDGDHMKLDFKTSDLNPGNYYLWLKVQEIDAPQNIGIAVPVVVK